MTTRFHIVNFGPDPIVIHPEDKSHPGQVIHPQSYADFYVYKGRVYQVSEHHIEEPKPVEEASGDV